MEQFSRDLVVRLRKFGGAEHLAALAFESKRAALEAAARTFFAGRRVAMSKLAAPELREAVEAACGAELCDLAGYGGVRSIKYIDDGSKGRAARARGEAELVFTEPHSRRMDCDLVGFFYPDCAVLAASREPGDWRCLSGRELRLLLGSRDEGDVVVLDTEYDIMKDSFAYEYMTAENLILLCAAEDKTFAVGAAARIERMREVCGGEVFRPVDLAGDAAAEADKAEAEARAAKEAAEAAEAARLEEEEAKLYATEFPQWDPDIDESQIPFRWRQMTGREPVRDEDLEYWRKRGLRHFIYESPDGKRIPVQIHDFERQRLRERVYGDKYYKTVEEALLAVYGNEEKWKERWKRREEFEKKYGAHNIPADGWLDE